MRRKSILLSLILVLICSTCLAACIGVKIKLYFKVDGALYATIDTNGHEAVAIPRDPVKDGYIFEGWYWDEGYWLKPFTTNSLLDAPIKESMSVYAKFRDENEPETPVTPNDPTSTIISGAVASYAVEYYQENIENSEYTLADRFILQGKSGTEVVAPEYSYYGFTLSDASESSGIINESGTLVLRVYFKRNVYTVTFSGGGGTLTSGTEVQSVKYLGSATAPEYKRDGKKFAGFDRSFNNVTQNTTVTAVWEDSNKKNYDLSGVSFSDTTVTYDGTAHSIYATNLPDGVTVTYEGNAQTEAGTYVITAKFSGDSFYNPIPDKTAILTIKKATIDVSNVIFLDKTVEYDGEPQEIKAINLPDESINVVYYYYKDGDEVDYAIDQGEYLVIMVFITGTNYESLPNKTATLTITRESYENDYAQYGQLGKTIDLVNATDLVTVSGGKKVFNDDLYYNEIYRENINKQNGESSSYSSLVEMMNSYTSDVSLKISAGSRKNKNGGFLTNKLPSISVSASSGFTAKRKSQTKEYSYNYSYIKDGYRVDISGYKDPSYFSKIISDELISDALKVRSKELSAQKFISMWGTHVIMSAVYGERVDVFYQAIDTSAASEAEWRNAIESELSMRFAKTGVDASVSASSNVLKSETTSTSWSSLRIDVSSKKTFGATTLENFYSDYSTWINQHADGTDYTTLVDFADDSLYCVWYLLGNEYQDVIDILDEYMYNNCSELYAEKIKAINSLMINDDIEFNSKTGELSINLDVYQQRTDDISEFNGESPFSGIYEITPYYQGKPIKSIVINGGYYTRNTSGQVIKNLVSPFSLKFDKDWDTDINITLNNVGVKITGANGFLDISELTKDVAVNLTYNGINEIIDEEGNSPAALRAKDINITSTDSVGSLILRGGNSNANGGSGGDGLFAEKLTVNAKGSVYAYGGNGGNGEKGTNGSSSWSMIEAQTGGTSGYGGCGINANIVIINKLNELNAYGGQGGVGGQGGDSIFSSRGGAGGIGGNGGIGLKADNLTIESVNTINAYGGQGGAGGQVGTNGNGKSGGQGGAGGIGFKTNNLTIESVNAINAYGGQGGVGGQGGDGYTGSTLEGHNNDRADAGGAGGAGGNGGNGGWAIVVGGDGISLKGGKLLIHNGSGGQGGQGGNGGRGGDAVYSGLFCGTCGHGGNGGAGGKGGANPYTDAQSIAGDVEVYNGSSLGGNGGNGGSKGSSESDYSSHHKANNGSKGANGTAGEYIYE